MRASVVSITVMVIMFGSEVYSQGRPTFTMGKDDRVVGLYNLPGSPDCALGSSTGRVVKRQTEQGALHGFTFKDVKHGDGFINVPLPSEFKDVALRKRVAEAFSDLIVVGQQLRLNVRRCGASGTFEELASVALMTPASQNAGTPTSDDPPGTLKLTAMARKPSGWRVTMPSTLQTDIEIKSSDRAFHLSVTCMRDVGGRVQYYSFFVGPRQWQPMSMTTAVMLDGGSPQWELGGADEGYSISDAIEDGGSTLSANARAALSKGEKLVIPGHYGQRRLRNAVFDLSNGESAWASYEQRCQALPRR